MGKPINRIPGSHLLISSLPGLASRMHVVSLGKPCDVNKWSRSLCLANLISKDTHLVFSMYPQASQCQQAFSKPCLVNGKLDIKRHLPSIHYVPASLAMSTSLLKALPGKLDIKRNSPSSLYISASLAMSTSILKAFPGKLDIKRHSPSILYVPASLPMSTSVLKALPGKLDIKRHSPSILYI